MTAVDSKLPNPTSRWADELDDDDDVVGLPAAPAEIALKDGERLVAEIVVDPDSGKKKKITRTFKLEKKLVSKGVVERKKWTKFGQSKRDNPGPNSATTVVGDEIQMQFLGKELEVQELNPFDKMKAEGKSFVRCRFCQESHFSAKCPYKEAGIPAELLFAQQKDALLDDVKKIDSEAKPGIFVPPALRGGGNRRGETMMPSNRKDDATIRVSNLPESMSETDMQELCTPFGKIERIFLAKDRATGFCKGFAFVTYLLKENAARAMKALNGYGYDHLILNVEWSKPTAP